MNSGQIVKIEDLTPRPLLIKTFSEETDDQYTGTPYKTGLDLNSCSSLMNQTPRWGQVSSPASFRKHCKEESSSSVDSRIPGRVNKNPQSVEKTTKRNGAKEVIKALTSRVIFYPCNGDIVSQIPMWIGLFVVIVLFTTAT